MPEFRKVFEDGVFLGETASAYHALFNLAPIEKYDDLLQQMIHTNIKPTLITFHRYLRKARELSSWEIAEQTIEKFTALGSFLSFFFPIEKRSEYEIEAIVCHFAWNRHCSVRFF